MGHITTQHTLINGQRIAYGIHGAGIPVILIHGTPSSSYIWRDIVPPLVKSGYKVHVFDLLGFGLSERPQDLSVDTSVSAQVPILESLMGYWGLETAHIIAHDIGGAVAKRLAVFKPEYFRSLTLIDIVSFDSWPSARTRQQMQAGLDRMIAAPDQQHRDHFRNWLLSAVHNKTRFAQTSLNVYLDFISGPVGQASLFQHQIRHYDPKHTLEVADRLHELGNLPLQLIWGENDAWQIIDWAYKLNAAIPNSELYTLKDCGHFAMEDQPDKISDLLKDFLKRNS